MAHSYVSSVFHIVFSTKGRTQLIRADLQPRLWNYMAAIARNHGVRVLAVGGTTDHVHVLVELPAEAKLAEVVRTVECNSSRWVREKCPIFQWQQGYGAFSVSPSQVERVKQYVRNQAEPSHPFLRGRVRGDVGGGEAELQAGTGVWLSVAPEGA